MGPDYGAALQVLVFLTVTVIQILLSLAVFSYCAHSFLNIFVNTTAGNEEVMWPKDPYQDWIFKIFFLVWILSVWKVHGGIIVGILEMRRPMLLDDLVCLLRLIIHTPLLYS